MKYKYTKNKKSKYLQASIAWLSTQPTPGLSQKMKLRNSNISKKIQITQKKDYTFILLLFIAFFSLILLLLLLFLQNKDILCYLDSNDINLNKIFSVEFLDKLFSENINETENANNQEERAENSREPSTNQNVTLQDNPESTNQDSAASSPESLPSLIPDRDVDPNAVRENISRRSWCELTASDPTPCSHTEIVEGCTHCEYNAGDSPWPTFCHHGRDYHPDCNNCDNAQWYRENYSDSDSDS